MIAGRADGPRLRRGRGAGGMLACVLAGGLAAGGVRGQNESSATDWRATLGGTLESVGERLETWLPTEWVEDYRLPTREEWSAFWGAALTALRSDDPAELAALSPYAHEALGLLDAVPWLSPYGDWLRQRMDFFDVAAESMTPPPGPRAVPSTRPAWPQMPPPSQSPPRRPAPPPPSSSSRPAPPPARPAVSAPARATVTPESRTVDYWVTRLESRRVPAQRTEVIPRLKAIFREEGVPEELVWLAETESTLNPKARSPAGAAGLFQFMPATATRFGLLLAPEDERLEPEKSARAAAQYLRFLNGRFQDWPLALAAYNAGEGRVGSALRRGGAQQTFEAAAPHLPVETQLYVPKVLATIQLREGRAFDPRG